VPPPRPRSPYEGARVEELEEPLLPRWFVLLALAAIPLAFGVAVWAFVVFGPDDVPVAERRPPPDPAGQLTTDVGGYNVGGTTAEVLPLEGCELFRGLRAAGSELDRRRIEEGLLALCAPPIPEDVARRVRDLARAGGEIRFAQFQATGVDSTLDRSTDPPRLLLNARFARQDTDPRWIAPLVAHDTTYLEREAAARAPPGPARTPASCSGCSTPCGRCGRRGSASLRRRRRATEEPAWCCPSPTGRGSWSSRGRRRSTSAA
jgi:hypothetical protein